ncbi:uncharacterized protein LOC121972512 [Zingiber officinale]|uniref:uncharacterized protein LOC121972512 n=1 Tax=Zingiber officinale TaxID=94328 RepID=UPI001C4D17DC|nr:uncharacterized protein LOC121972512 [Zingiber officinale]
MECQLKTQVEIWIIIHTGFILPTEEGVPIACDKWDAQTRRKIEADAKATCAAFASQDLYLHGFFSASIKLPSDYVAGVVVAFYHLRRIKVRDKGSVAKSGVRRGIASRNIHRIADQESPLHPPLYPLRRSESAGSENHNSRSVSSSPDKDDRCYTTRGSAALVCEGENADERASAASLPRFFVSLSNKEEEDFMVMKGCKLPQRPKKRSKFVQKCILLVSPGAWLSDLSQERYVVREKKGSRKRRRGLKAMSMESDSE